ncbi:MAG: ribosome maturation factor RimP [Acutalibacteraceae bacterium]|nr:ribosome maturation factor RimP [Acutalibacteraceae bacterium]
MASIAEKVYALVKETVESCGVNLWDVRFVKEGASHYLRIFIDKPDGITINDCTDVSHAVDPIIDEADPIDGSYYLEVCSPGTERELTREHHFEYGIGKTVTVKLFKALDGKKEFTGVLKAYNGDLTLDTEKGEMTFAKGSYSKVCICETL